MSGEALNPMNTQQSHPPSLFVLGLALALKKVRAAGPEVHTPVRAFLFDFSSIQAATYAHNLFGFVRSLQLHNMWIEECLRIYFDDTDLQNILIRDQSMRMFQVEKKIHPESCFDFSTIKVEYGREANEIYSRHELSYEKIVQGIYKSKPYLGPSHQLGIIFVSQDD